MICVINDYLKQKKHLQVHVSAFYKVENIEFLGA
jgi:hypothetical protein